MTTEVSILVLVTPSTDVDSPILHSAIRIGVETLAAAVGCVNTTNFRYVFHAHVGTSSLVSRLMRRGHHTHLTFATEAEANSAITRLSGHLTSRSSSEPTHNEPSIHIANEAGPMGCADRYVHVGGSVSYQHSVAHTLVALTDISGIIFPAHTHQHSSWVSSMRSSPAELVADALVAHGGAGVAARTALTRRSRLPVPMLVIPATPEAPTPTSTELTAARISPLEGGPVLAWIDGQHYAGQPTPEGEVAARLVVAHAAISAEPGGKWADVAQSFQGDTLVRLLLTQALPPAMLYPTSALTDMEGCSIVDSHSSSTATYGDTARLTAVKGSDLSADLVAQVVASAVKGLGSRLPPNPTQEESASLEVSLQKAITAMAPFAIPVGVAPGYGGRCLSAHLAAELSAQRASVVVMRAHPMGGKNRWTSSAVRDANSALLAHTTSAPLLLL